MRTATFPLADVLSVTTGILVGPVDGIYRVCDHMEGFFHWTHGLPDAANRVTPEILRQHPVLAEAHPPKISGKDDADRWVAEVAAYVGSTELLLIGPDPER